MKFSANLGFLWADLSLPDAIRAAAAAGFDAIELHWPYDVPASEVAAVLAETGLPCLGLNTRRGDLSRGENGLAALPGRGPEARAAIDEALAYGAEIGARHVHVMAGVAIGPEAHAAFRDALGHACDRAEAQDMAIVIEPLNPFDAPGYFLRTTEQAVAIMDEIGHAALRLMFDCYHVQRTEGDVSRRLRTLMPRIGHIQFAAVPDRGPPDHGEIAYSDLFDLIETLGYDRPLGAEYKPGDTPTEATLAWLSEFRAGQGPSA